MSAGVELSIALRRVPIGLAYAATQVNATVFRVGALASFGERQYTTYYGPDTGVVVGRRRRDEDRWKLARVDARGNVRDAHNGAVLGVSPDGFVHLAYDHHNGPLRYRVSGRPGAIDAFGPERPMTGRLEARVTYPQFVAAPDGTRFFCYRDGMSGNGRLCLNRYDPETRAWVVVQHPLIDGTSGAVAGARTCNPYWWRPAFGPDGALHLAWCWRDTPDGGTNHDICYTRSPDGGRTWLRGDGAAQDLPITPANAEVIDPVPVGANLLNQCSCAVDAAGRPHLAHYQNDSRGIPQYVHLWHDGRRWLRAVVSRRETPFSLVGTGSLLLPISRPEIAILPDGTVCLIAREEGQARLYHARGDYSRWASRDLDLGDLGEWEPTYDLGGFARDGRIDLFVLPVRQGDHETATDFPPQGAAVVEVRLGGQFPGSH